VLLIKGQKADEELAEAGEALHQLKAVHTATVNTPTGRVVVLEKRSATPKMYPRRDGEPARSPILARRRD
jgi:16S rRNA (guanine527-N7)-methyltransferase